jgi:hypothetical protein
MPAPLRVAGGLAALVLAAAGGSVGLEAARAVAAQVPAAAGAPGYCHTATGVTVVVDMTVLGGGVTVRCAPGSSGAGYSGLDALRGAGFSVTGTQRYGTAFVCRIQGRPTATEPLAIPGNPRYREQCVDTPPQTAFWSYWSAPNGGPWTYNTSGAASHDAIPGGFEGWAFSLSPSGSPATPRVAPVRPHQAPPPAPPSQTTPPPRPHHRPAGGGAPAPTTSSATSGSPAPPTSTSVSPTTAASGDRGDSSAGTRGPSAGAGTSGHRRHHTSADHVTSPASTSGPTSRSGDHVRVSGDLPHDGEQSAGSAHATLIGAGVLVLLGLGAGMTAWRRTHRG